MKTILTFTLTIVNEKEEWPFRVLRNGLLQVVGLIPGLSLVAIEVDQEPDPFQFEDPDNLPRGVY